MKQAILNRSTRTVIVLAGPTCSGKTALSLRLASQLPCEIVSVDSMLVYQSMDVGTAKPSVSERNEVPHHLIDIRLPTAPYSVAQFRAEAVQCIDDILSRQRIPLLVGGTALYFHALINGLSQLPAVDAAVRAQLFDIEDLAVLYQRLQRIDPVAAQRIHPNDTQRIQRALEVYAVSGKTMTALRLEQPPQPVSSYQWLNIVLAPTDRRILHARIEQRFDDMLSAGLVQEVQSLLQQYPELSADYPCLRAVGYSQVLQHLNEHLSLSQMKMRAIFATRQMAKRQLTWFKRWETAHWLDMTSTTLDDQICTYIQMAAQQRQQDVSIAMNEGLSLSNSQSY